MSSLPWLDGYPQHVVQPVRDSLQTGQLGVWLQKRYTDGHAIQSDSALYAYTSAIKQRHLKHAPALARVAFDNQQHPLYGILGSNAFISRVQGGRLKSKNEIRIAAVLRQAPEPFLRMVVVHELAHLKEKDHNKAFYQLCTHMEPDYVQLEFDLRVWLTWREHTGQ